MYYNIGIHPVIYSGLEKADLTLKTTPKLNAEKQFIIIVYSV